MIFRSHWFSCGGNTDVLSAPKFWGLNFGHNIADVSTCDRVGLMPSPVDPPNLLVYAKEALSDWGSKVSGILSIPFTIFALIVAIGLLGDQSWWNSKWALFSWFSIALLAWAWTGYAVWRKERLNVIELHGRPQVTLKCRMMKKESDWYPHFSLMNHSETDAAVNVSLAGIREPGFDITFSRVDRIGRHEEYVSYAILVGTKKTEDFFLVTSTTQSLPTILEFSNYGEERTWQLHYTLEIDHDNKLVSCRAGTCSLKNRVAAKGNNI